MKMEECPHFERCDAPLCPLDPGVGLRVYYVGEDICTVRAGSGIRWIRKQRSVTKRQTASYLNRPVTHQELVDASRPRAPRPPMSKERREELIGYLAKAVRQRKKSH